MTERGSKLKVPAKIAAIALLAQLFILRITTWADADHVWILGRQLHWGCWFKQHFGIPCPTCGMTRSIILTLRGQLDQAFTLNAGGPFLVGGLTVFALVLYYRASVTHDPRSSRRLAICSILYGWMFAVVVVGQWTLRIAS